jgi:oligopeptidase B
LYLEQENRYAKNVLRKTKAFEELLYDEMAARVPAKEDGLPERIQNWLYYVRTEEGGNGFPIYCRRPHNSDAAREEIVLDQNALARNKPYLSVPQCKFSLCHTMLAFTADTTGAERYTGYVKDLRTGDIVVSRAAPARPSRAPAS